MHQDCPVCCEFLFDSLKRIAVLKCGHTIHNECLSELVKHGGTKCPLCSKSLVDRSIEWRRLDMEVRSDWLATHIHVEVMLVAPVASSCC